MKQGTQSWCSGTTQRDGVGREVRVSATAEPSFSTPQLGSELPIITVVPAPRVLTYHGSEAIGRAPLLQ